VAWDARYDPPIQTWDAWGKDPIKKAVIMAISPTFARTPPEDWDIVWALTQRTVCFIYFHPFRVEGVHC
jgi:hypothetical protein